MRLIARPTTDRARLTRLSKAFRLLVETWRRDGDFDPGRARQDPHPRALRAGCADELAELLSGQRKDWARGLDEIALSLHRRDKRVLRVGLVQLSERRRIVAGWELDPEAEEFGTRLKSIFAGKTGILVSGSSGRADRAAIGTLLAEHRIGQGRLAVTETPRELGGDYRDLLAGSAWLDLPPPDAGDALGQALMLALQIRSLRQRALKNLKQGYYTALAAAALARQGLPPEGISERLGIGLELARKWAGRNAAESAAAPSSIGEEASDEGPEDEAGPSSITAARPASDKQRRFGERILAELPFLGAAAEPGWEEDFDKARRFLGRAAPFHQEWRGRIADFRASRRARRLLADGLSLAAVAAALEKPVNDVLRLLEMPLAEDIAEAEAALSAALRTEIDLGAALSEKPAPDSD